MEKIGRDEIKLYLNILNDVKIEVLGDILFLLARASVALYDFREDSSTSTNIDDCKSLINAALTTLEKCETLHYITGEEKEAVKMFKEKFLKHKEAIDVLTKLSLSKDK